MEKRIIFLITTGLGTLTSMFVMLFVDMFLKVFVVSLSVFCMVALFCLFKMVSPTKFALHTIEEANKSKSFGKKMFYRLIIPLIVMGLIIAFANMGVMFNMAFH